MARTTNKLTIPSSTRHLEKVRRFVEDHTLEAGFPVETVEQFKVAVDEACTNVIKHAYHGEAKHQIIIEVIIDAEQLTVSIQDEGESFHPEEYTKPDLFELAKRRQKGGFGVQIMRRLMDNVLYVQHGKKNEVRLMKYRTPNQNTRQNGNQR